MSPHIDNHTLGLILSDRIHAVDFDSFSPADWDILLEKAQSEGVAPLVYWELSTSGKLSSAPDYMHRALRAVYFSLKMKNEELLRELASLMRSFERVGILVVALKGVCFALTIYPDIGLRPMADLDLLVPASKLSEAVAIVKTYGYVETVPEVFPGLNKLLGGEVCLQKTGVPFVLLELHNSLLVDRSFTYAAPVDWFWEQTERLDCSLLTGFENLRMLTPTAQVLYAAAHTMLKHGGRSTCLRWYYDLDRLICFYPDRINWDLLLTKAKAFQWSSALDAAFSQTHDYFNSPIPDHVLADLSQTKDRHRNLLALKQSSPPTRVLEEFQNIAERKWYGRLILILGLVAPGPSYMRWRYGLKTSWMLPAWYLYRWSGIFKDVLRTLVVLFQKNRFIERNGAERVTAGDSS